MRGEKNIIGVEGFDKSDRIHYKGKIALTYKKKKTLGTSKELFEFTIKIIVSKNCSNCTCLMLILSPHIFFSVLLRFFLFFFLLEIPGVV